MALTPKGTCNRGFKFSSLERRAFMDSRAGPQQDIEIHEIAPCLSGRPFPPSIWDFLQTYEPPAGVGQVIFQPHQTTQNAQRQQWISSLCASAHAVFSPGLPFSPWLPSISCPFFQTQLKQPVTSMRPPWPFPVHQQSLMLCHPPGSAVCSAHPLLATLSGMLPRSPPH